MFLVWLQSILPVFFSHVLYEMIQILSVWVCSLDKQDYCINLPLPMVLVVIALFLLPELRPSSRLGPWVGGWIFLSFFFFQVTRSVRVEPLETLEIASHRGLKP